MNRIYKVVFNRDRGMLEVVSKLARSAVKSGTKLVVTTAVGAALMAGSVAYAQTATTSSEGSNFVVRNGGFVVSDGDAEISAGGLKIKESLSAANGQFSVDHNTGNTNITKLKATTADIDGGTIDNTTITGENINDAAIGGNSTINTSGNINTSGTLSSNGLNAGTGQITGSGGMNVSNGEGANIYMGGQDVVTKGGFVVSDGDAEISAGSLKIKESLSAANGQFSVDHNTGNTNVKNLNSTGDASVGGTLGVAGKSNLHDTDVNGNLTVEGESNLKGTTTIASNAGSNTTIGNKAGKTDVKGKDITVTGSNSVTTTVGNSTIK